MGRLPTNRTVAIIKAISGPLLVGWILYVMCWALSYAVLPRVILPTSRDDERLQVSLFKGDLCIRRSCYVGVGIFPRLGVEGFSRKEAWKNYHSARRPTSWLARWLNTDLYFKRIPIWMVGLPVLFCPIVIRARAIRRRLRRYLGRCELCGYALNGLPEPRCPECGTPFLNGVESKLEPASAPERAALVGAGSGAACGIAVLWICGPFAFEGLARNVAFVSLWAVTWGGSAGLFSWILRGRATWLLVTSFAVSCLTAAVMGSLRPGWLAMALLPSFVLMSGLGATGFYGVALPSSQQHWDQ